MLRLLLTKSPGIDETGCAMVILLFPDVMWLSTTWCDFSVSPPCHADEWCNISCLMWLKYGASTVFQFHIVLMLKALLLWVFTGAKQTQSLWPIAEVAVRRLLQGRALSCFPQKSCLTCLQGIAKTGLSSWQLHLDEWPHMIKCCIMCAVFLVDDARSQGDRELLGWQWHQFLGERDLGSSHKAQDSSYQFVIKKTCRSYSLVRLWEGRHIACASGFVAYSILPRVICRLSPHTLIAFLLRLRRSNMCVCVRVCVCAMRNGSFSFRVWDIHWEFAEYACASRTDGDGHMTESSSRPAAHSSQEQSVPGMHCPAWPGSDSMSRDSNSYCHYISLYLIIFILYVSVPLIRSCNCVNMLVLFFLLFYIFSEVSCWQHLQNCERLQCNSHPLRID